MHVRILIDCTLARAKDQVTGTRESFLPEARSNPRLCYSDLFVIRDRKTKEISVFIDESGSFESNPDSSRYYMVCMVFHDQSVDLTTEIQRLGDSLDSMGLPADHCVHAGPLIRREKEYAGKTREERRGIFDRMMAFLRKSDISYKYFCVDKHFLGKTKDVHDPLLQKIQYFLLANADAFNSFDRLKVYYDNGQSALTGLIKEAFALFASRTEFVPDVEPSKYRLFQVADIACTLELAREKMSRDEGLSESEKVFFGGTKNLKKNYLKVLDRKIFA